MLNLGVLEWLHLVQHTFSIYHLLLEKLFFLDQEHHAELYDMILYVYIISACMAGAGIRDLRIWVIHGAPEHVDPLLLTKATRINSRVTEGPRIKASRP